MHMLFCPVTAIAVLSAGIFVQNVVHAQSGQPAGVEAKIPQTTVWRFDQLESVGGHPATALGHPHLIDSPYGKAVEFNGIDDALFVDVHPLAGASAFTWEVIFRPDAGGAEAQRFFHLQEVDPITGQDTLNRMLLEIRIVNGQWCLDSYAETNGQRRTLLNCQLLHSLGKWYRVTAVYDGKVFSNYVDGELQSSGSLQLVPQGPGRSSIGTRINKTFYFKGAILLACMTPRALPLPQIVCLAGSTAHSLARQPERCPRMIASSCIPCESDTALQPDTAECKHE